MSKIRQKYFFIWFTHEHISFMQQYLSSNQDFNDFLAPILLYSNDDGFQIGFINNQSHEKQIKERCAAQELDNVTK